MTYTNPYEPVGKPIDPFQPPHESAARVKNQITRDKSEADSLGRQMLFTDRSLYSGSPAALKRMAAKAGKRMPETHIPLGVKPGTEEE